MHDPDNHPDHFQEAKDGAIKAMIKLKEDGLVTALGCGLNQNEMLVEFAKMGCFDCFLLAGRYTLLDQTSLDELIPICEKNNISLILGGVFNSGILINPSPQSYFDYTKLDSDWFENLEKSLLDLIRICTKKIDEVVYLCIKSYDFHTRTKKFGKIYSKCVVDWWCMNIYSKMPPEADNHVPMHIVERSIMHEIENNNFPEYYYYP